MCKHLHTKFHMPTPNSSSVINTKPTAKYRLHVATISLVYILQKLPEQKLLILDDLLPRIISRPYSKTR
jgi:hypothetical protein